MKFYTYAVMMVGIIMILNLAGVVTPVGGGLAKSLNLINDDQEITIDDFKSSELWSNSSATDNTKGLTFILIGALAAGVVLGAFGRAPDIRYITAAFVFGIAALIVADMIAIFTIISSFDSWMKYGLGLIMGGLLVGFFISTLEFWQGSD